VVYIVFFFFHVDLTCGAFFGSGEDISWEVGREEGKSGYEE
jgi:hypothetical protein